MGESTQYLYRGEYVSLKQRDGWEYAARRNPLAAVLIAFTDAGELLLVEQYRPPVDGRVIELPAGLVGDEKARMDETVLAAAARELEEETGYRARELVEWMRCPTSAGLTDELAVFVRANGLFRTGPGGGDAGEDIRVHHIAPDHAATWLDERARAGFGIDPKIYAALYWSLTRRFHEDRRR